MPFEALDILADEDKRNPSRISMYKIAKEVFPEQRIIRNPAQYARSRFGYETGEKMDPEDLSEAIDWLFEQAQNNFLEKEGIGFANWWF